MHTVYFDLIYPDSSQIYPAMSLSLPPSCPFLFYFLMAHWVQFVLLIYSWIRGYPSEHGQPIRYHSLTKADFLFPSSHQLFIASVGWVLPSPSSPCWMWSGLSCAGSRSRCGLRTAGIPLCPPQPLALTLCLLCALTSEPREGHDIDAPFVAERAMDAYSLHFLTSCEFLY